MTEARRAQAANGSRIAKLITDAFRTDPLLRWVWPTPDRYEACALPFFGLMLDRRLTAGEAWVIEEDGFIASIALWTPPGGLYAEPAPEVSERVYGRFTTDERERWRVYQDLLAEGHPRQPHWYLGVLATSAQHRRHGLGRRVLEPMLKAADRTGTTAALDTANPMNRPFYRSLGFEEAAELRLPAGPQLWLMVRSPAI